MYRDYVASKEQRAGGAKTQAGQAARKAAEAWRRSHLISFTFIADEFLPNPEFAFPAS